MSPVVPLTDCLQQDFGEVAYIVCSVANPPGSSPVQAPPTETTIARLKQTEGHFRNASILAALDVDSLQLFTFYKKVDVMKDQRTLLAKFGNILRSNYCIISYKAATRAPELLKPENAKLHRLFISAILANVKIPPHDSRQILNLGQRYHALENPKLEDIENTNVPIPWTLIRTDLQIVTSGQVLLTLVADISHTLFTIGDIHWQWKNIQKPQQNAVPVIIAPFGHLATYTGGWIGCCDEARNASGLGPEPLARLYQWRRYLSYWAKTDAESPFHDADDEIWVQLQIPWATSDESLSTEAEQGCSEPKNGYEFKAAFWPADLCFSLRSSNTTPLLERIGLEDPIAFVQEWRNTAKERLAEEENTGRMASSSAQEEDDDAELFSDETTFEHQEPFGGFGPPPFAMSQTVYPTPPDVMMTHATPGMYSADGTVMTPANGVRTAPEALPVAQDLEMTGVDPMQAAAVGSGFYDEDLFEDMPDDDFDHAGAGDDPDWDFFDKPDIDVEQTEPIEKKEHAVDKASASDNKDLSGPLVTSGDSIEITSSPAHGEEAGLSSPAGSRTPPLKIRHGRLPSTEPFPEFESPVPLPATVDGTGQEPNNAPKEQSSGYANARRSSIYDITLMPVESPEKDSRYTSQGMFWFDNSAKMNSIKQPNTLPGWKERTPSTSSASDISTTEDGTSSPFDAQRPDTIRQWTLYEPASPEMEEKALQLDVAAIEEETADVFDHLKAKSATLSLENTVHSSKKPNLGIPKDKPGLSLLFSQLFVEQYAQSTLIRCLQRDKPGDGKIGLVEHLVPDLTDLNANSTYATICQLSGFGLGQGTDPADGRLLKIPERQIKFRRGEKPMVASTSIVSFWDTLGLQPLGTMKDVTAFCVHPPGSGVADGCANFLDRIADAYSNCSLGLHKRGHLLKMTENGLLTWSLERDKTSSLVSIAMRLGEALALTEEISGTVVLYIIGLSADPTSYLQCCVGFYACYQAYKKSMRARTENLELVLQVVPASFVASTETIVVPSQLDYNALALEAYSRLPPLDPNSRAGSCDFPLTLADSGNGVRFSLEASPISPYSKGGGCLHLAYAHSDDQRWTVGCWTDDVGQLALTMTYLIRTDANDRGRPEKDILQDMWEVSQDLMKPHRSRWRLVVSRTGFYEIAEENFWMHLANSEATEERTPCTLQLLSVELAPSMQISLPTIHANGGQLQHSSQPNTDGTPATSPPAIMTSPEQMVPATPTPGGTSAFNAPTPPEQGFDANIDGELSLVDSSEESWMMILPFGMNQAHDIMGVKQALASGYLLKRSGRKDEDGLCSIGVHLKHTPDLPAGVGNQYDEALEDIIRQFRGLVTLVAARGVIDRVKQCVPWHIHTAVTGAKGLSGLI